MTRGQENGGLFGWDITLDRQGRRHEAFGHLPALGGVVFLTTKQMPTIDELRNAVGSHDLSTNGEPDGESVDTNANYADLKCGLGSDHRWDRELS